MAPHGVFISLGCSSGGLVPDGKNMQQMWQDLFKDIPGVRLLAPAKTTTATPATIKFDKDGLLQDFTFDDAPTVRLMSAAIDGVAKAIHGASGDTFK
jgi:hypothetical protein